MKTSKRINAWISPATLLALLCLPVMGQNRPELIEIAHSDQQWTGVAVSQEGRIFVNFPRWTPRLLISVAEVFPDGNRQSYPDDNWNTWETGKSPADHLVCVQSVYVDSENSLWILDPANPEFKGVVPGGPKLVKVNLGTNGVEQIFHFDDKVAPQKSYLNDLRVDTQNGFAYITDSGLGALVVVNLKNGQARRLLGDDSSTKSEGTKIVIDGKQWQGLPNGSQDVHSDGVALDNDGKYLYFHALTGRTLRRIETRWLREETSDSLAAKVETLGETGPADGLEIDRYGNVYFSALQESAVKRFTPERHLETVVLDERLAWPDSFAWQGEWLYVTTSQIHYGKKPPGPYRLFKFKPATQVTPTGRPAGTSNPH
jgi:sugar lactone lactonase YvrE